MSRTRLLAAAAALFLLAAGARADEPKKDAAPVDPKIEALVKAAVEKAKQELRDELRVEVQGAQSAAEFLGTAAEGPRLELLELDGYLRVRADLFDAFDLGRAVATGERPIFPRPIVNPDSRSTLAGANMRLRLLPTLNVSEHVRVRVQADVLDNYVLGSTLPGSGEYLNAPSGAQYGGATSTDRPVVNVKRAWGEVETPLGLLSFGRMPATWGLGIRHPVQDGLDDDWGNTVDRLQFATLPLTTPLGSVSLVPFIDFRSEGTIQTDPRTGGGSGQPFDLDSTDDARTFGLKLLHLDTEEELRRKLERGEKSFNYGFTYEYQTWPSIFPAALTPTGTTTDATNPDQRVARNEYEHVLDVWLRLRTARFHLEAELAGQVGQIGNPTLLPTGTGADRYSGGQVLVRTLGGALKASYQAMPNRLTLGGELGFASGDRAPGFGNVPGQVDTTGGLLAYGALEGPQSGDYTLNGTVVQDRSIRNFRFNPGYRVDLILWREILGQVTDAFYLRPSLRWDIVSGLAFDAAVIYSQAIYSRSTPSATSTSAGSSPLGIELDGRLAFTGDEGFSAWLQYGLLQPLAGFGPGSLSRAHALRAGLAIKF